MRMIWSWKSLLNSTDSALMVSSPIKTIEGLMSAVIPRTWSALCSSWGSHRTKLRAMLVISGGQDRLGMDGRHLKPHQIGEDHIVNLFESHTLHAFLVCIPIKKVVEMNAIPHIDTTTKLGHISRPTLPPSEPYWTKRKLKWKTPLIWIFLFGSASARACW